MSDEDIEHLFGASEPEGLRRKYRVERIDGKEDDPLSVYFVLRLGADPDPMAVRALECYAEQCGIFAFYALQDDLNAIICEAKIALDLKKNEAELQNVHDRIARLSTRLKQALEKRFGKS